MGFTEMTLSFVNLILTIGNRQNRKWTRASKKRVFVEEILGYKLNGDNFAECPKNFSNITDNEEWIGKREFLGKVKELNGMDTQGKMEFDFTQKVS